MSNTLLAVDMSRGLSRTRLFFANALASGAFTSTSYYAIASADGLGPAVMNVVAVFAVASNSAAVELAVEPPMNPGGLYTLTATSVPCADSSTFTGSLQGRTGIPVAAPPNVEPERNDFTLLLYSRDLLYQGNDFAETAGGDLATVSGQANYFGAIERRMSSSGLTWDPGYGPRADQYVNAPDALSRPLAGVLVAQARADDRTAQATVQVVTLPGDASGNGWLFEVTVVGKDGLAPKTLTVPPSKLAA